MKRVYLACVRSIDLLTSLPEWDGKNVIVQGGSQGGALALVTAGLDQRVTACVANHPALSDMAGYKAGRAGGYPHFFRNTVDMDTPEKIRTMAYYDEVPGMDGGLLYDRIHPEAPPHCTPSLSLYSPQG